jgi:hypothetical protein
LNPDNRFVPEAVQMAFEILKERGCMFTETEKLNIQNIIQYKKETEEARRQEEIEEWKDHITEDGAAIKLYSRTSIMILAILFGTIPGSILLSLNSFCRKKIYNSHFQLTDWLWFFYLQNYILSQGFASDTSSRYSPEMGIIASGALILLAISVAGMPKKLPYRPKSLLFPVILIVFMSILMYNFKEWGSAYLIVSALRLIRSF